MKKNAILLACHTWNDTMIQRLKTMASNPLYDFYILFHTGNQEQESKMVTNDVYTIFSFSDRVLKDMGYTPIKNRLLPGSNHFGLLSFYKSINDYSYYWYIEDDVFYNGKWSTFFNYFHQNNISADFISSYVVDFENLPHWNWWPIIYFRGRSIPNEYKIRSFNPIYRISNQACALIDQMLRLGWSGHHEVVLPTLLYHGDMEIKDFGGTGEYILDGCANRFYKRDDANLMNDTMRYRPEIALGELNEELLYHPLKIFRRW